MSMFPVWLHCTDERVIELFAEPGAGFNVRMFPEQIDALERWFGALAWIATDTPDNVIWRKP